MTAAGAPPAPSPRINQRVLGLFAAENQAVLAVALLALVNLVRNPVGPPEPVNRGLALGLVYALPAVVGGLGAWAGRRPLLVAAAVACTVGSILSFSGVTLLFLVPALLFAVAAIAPRREKTETGGLAAALSGAAAPRRGRDWSGVARGVLLAITLAALMVGSGVSLLALTEARCWIGEESPSGVIDYRIVPDIYGVSVDKGGSAGCSSADLTVRGAVVAAILGLGALGLAVRATIARRPDEPGDGRPGPTSVTEAEVTT
jgi:hypothetical protein